VVDDGSTDATGSLARAAGAEVIRHEVNRGYDSALNSGFARAAQLGFEYTITVDADGQHNPAQLAEFVRLLDEGNDLAIGRRDKLQRFAETIFAFVGRMCWGVSDPLCGMKAYRTDLYRAAGCFDRVGSIGTELAIRSIVSGCRFTQIAIKTGDRVDAPRFGRSLSANLRIMRALSLLLYMHVTRKLAIPRG
jgi:glycosyltransferase involved in cell wall biosynthesis